MQILSPYLSLTFLPSCLFHVDSLSLSLTYFFLPLTFFIHGSKGKLGVAGIIT
uniref:Uncharacterized protein n=1 Tax=Rhizophora mucronata TaxID=61149 RepID=A0A2P2NAA1_RHIMU